MSTRAKSWGPSTTWASTDEAPSATPTTTAAAVVHPCSFIRPYPVGKDSNHGHPVVPVVAMAMAVAEVVTSVRAVRREAALP